MRAGFLLAVVASAVAAPGMAAERAPADVAEQWGLIGQWAVDCRQAPTKQNIYYSYMRQGSSLLLQRDQGQIKDENEVMSAWVADDGGIELVTNFKAFSHVMTGHFVKDGADHFQLVFNRDEKGSYTAQDRKLTGTGTPTPVMTRCKPDHR